jgi:hypothetical protein
VWFNEAMRRVVDDKEQQLKTMQMRITSLVEECQRYQQTIRQLTDSRDVDPQGYKLVISCTCGHFREGATGITMSVCPLFIYSDVPINF